MKRNAPAFRVALLKILSALLLISCGQKQEAGAPSQPEQASPEQDKGIGRVREIHLGPIDPALAEKGKVIFTAKCSACHKLEGRYAGPPLGTVTKRRTPEFILNMILNPSEMTQKDPVAQRLLAEYLTPMTPQNLSEDDAKAVLEYLRQAAQ
ncbi:MAG: c-type cytochrome [Methylacidiphilaceae bacterium]|nr:c-type cytochrome [Candidatus Methylacidiphilaceae bacterium]